VQKLIHGMNVAWTWIKAAWTWLGANHEQVTIAFAVCAGLYVLFEYQSNSKDTDVKRTLELQARFGQKELIEARYKLENYWLSPQSKADLDLAPGSKNQKITKVILDHNLDGNVFLVADFLSQVATCVKKEICDVKTACATFKKNVVEMRNTYYDLFKRWEERWGENIGEASYKVFNESCPKTD
jgi:hypothetical protein